MNARMLELSGTDLLRNLLFSRVPSETDKDVLATKWTRIATTVGQEHVPDLIRYHLACSHPKVRERRIMELVEPGLHRPADVFALAADLERRGYLLAALAYEGDDFWAPYSAEVPGTTAAVREYKLFRVSQPTPLLFAAYERFDRADFIRTLRLVVLMTFRAAVVAQMSPSGFEPVYHRAAKGVLDGRLKRPRAVFEELHELHVSDEKFREDFANMEVETRGASKKIAKYILARLEQFTSKKPIDFETAGFTLEHIWPESRGWDWNPAETPRRIAPPVQRLGNLTLLEGSLNKEVGSKDFAVKVDSYAQSAYQLTREVESLNAESWTVAQIDARQRRLAEIAVRAWSLDFDA